MIPEQFPLIAIITSVLGTSGVWTLVQYFWTSKKDKLDSYPALIKAINENHIQPLQERLEEMKKEADVQKKEIAVLEYKVQKMEGWIAKQPKGMEFLESLIHSAYEV